MFVSVLLSGDPVDPRAPHDASSPSPGALAKGVARGWLVCCLANFSWLGSLLAESGSPIRWHDSPECLPNLGQLSPPTLMDGRGGISGPPPVSSKPSLASLSRWF